MTGNPSRRILVVGAGPAGLTAALELARRGFTPVIVEQGADLGPPEQSRALAVNVRTLQLLEPSGVTAKILDEAVAIRDLRISAGGRQLVTFDTTAIAGRYRGMHILPQGRTEKLLLDSLAEHGIAPRWQTQLRGLEPGENNATAILADASGALHSEPFDIIIGADGAHSAVRKATGFSFAGKALSETFYLADYTYAAEFDIDHVDVQFFDPGVLGRLPIDRKTVRYVSTLADFRDRIVHPGTVASVPWESEFHVSFRHVEEMSKGKIFLAGDAAHIHSPIGGRGMNLGIEDACWLAWLIANGRENEYSALRMPSVRKVIAQTETNTKMVLMRNPLLLFVRNLLLPLISALPFVRRRGMAGALGLDTPAPPWLDNQES